MMENWVLIYWWYRMEIFVDRIQYWRNFSQWDLVLLAERIWWIRWCLCAVFALVFIPWMVRLIRNCLCDRWADLALLNWIFKAEKLSWVRKYLANFRNSISRKFHWRLFLHLSPSPRKQLLSRKVNGADLNCNIRIFQILKNNCSDICFLIWWKLVKYFNLIFWWYCTTRVVSKR